MAGQGQGQSEEERAQQEEFESQTQIDYSSWASMTGEDYSERLEWQNQDTSDVLGREAKVGTIQEEAYILEFSLSSDQTLSPVSGSLLWFDTSTQIDAQPGEDTRAQFGTFSEAAVKTSGMIDYSSSDPESFAMAQWIFNHYNADGFPPVLTWATVNDASLTQIKGDLDAYYGEFTETREVNQSLAQWLAPKGLSQSRIWTLGQLTNISTTGFNYASTEDGHTRYSDGYDTTGDVTEWTCTANVGYGGTGELAYLSRLAGYEGHSTANAYLQALGWINSRIDSLVSTMLVPDVGNQIVNRTVDQGILKKT